MRPGPSEMNQSDVFGWDEGGEGGGREARGRRKEKGERRAREKAREGSKCARK